MSGLSVINIMISINHYDLFRLTDVFVGHTYNRLSTFKARVLVRMYSFMTPNGGINDIS